MLFYFMSSCAFFFFFSQILIFFTYKIQFKFNFRAILLYSIALVFHFPWYQRGLTIIRLYEILIQSDYVLYFIIFIIHISSESLKILLTSQISWRNLITYVRVHGWYYVLFCHGSCISCIHTLFSMQERRITTIFLKTLITWL